MPVFGSLLLSRIFDHLLACGISRFVVNTHHLPHVFDRFFGTHDGEFSYRGHPVRLVYEPVLLETGGGIRNVRQWVGEESFLVVNGDVFTDIPLVDLLKRHEESGGWATLGLRSFDGPLRVGMDVQTGSVLDFHGKLGRKELPCFLFTGIYALSPEIYDWIPAGESVSIIPVFLELLRARKRIAGMLLDSGCWGDTGSRESYLRLHQKLSDVVPENQRLRSCLPPGVELRGICAVGDDCEIEPGAFLEDTVIWDGVKISSRSRLRRCIVRDGSQVDGDFADCDL